MNHAYRFEPGNYMSRLGKKLVDEFADASQAGTPGLTGGARETSARTQLRRLLPAGVGIGTGLAIDTTGSVSRQQDILLYERDICPVFSINDDSSASWFPIEGIAASGEVKSVLSLEKLRQSFQNVESLKQLRRLAVPSDDGLGYGPTVSYRHFGSVSGFVGGPENQYDQDSNDTDRVFSFILCQKFSNVDSIFEEAVRLWSESSRDLTPDLIVSLADGFITPCAQDGLILSASSADGFALCRDATAGFSLLVPRLSEVFREYRTVSNGRYSEYLRNSTSNEYKVEIRML